MRTKGNFLQVAIAAGAAFALLTGCGQEKKPENETAFDAVDPLSLPLGERHPDVAKLNSNIPPIDELRKQYRAAEAKRMKEMEPKLRYAYNKLYKPYTVYPQSIALPQLPKSSVTFARNPSAPNEPKVVVLSTQDGVENIESFYANKLKNEGWQSVAQKGNAAYHEVVAVKGQQQMTVTIYLGVYANNETVVRIETKPRRS